jgi:hypothetical protein
MALCPSCEYPIIDDRQSVGARCPNCRDPLYEPPGRFGRPVREGEGACGVHADCESVGPCGRCGNFMCETCRTKWRDQILCAACVGRALESKEASPEQSRTQRRQALTALGLGIGAWVVYLIGVVLLILVVGAAQMQGQVTPAAAPGLLAPVLVILVALAAAVGMALVGMGQAVAVLRARGSHMILSTIGLVVSTLFVALLVSNLTLFLEGLLGLVR